MRSEDELIGALRTAGEHAPDGGGDLLAGVALRRRRRTRRRVRVLAAAAAVVVLSVGIRGAVLSREGGGDMATTPAPEPPVPRSAPVEELWPGAVFTLPVEAPDGARRVPMTGISPTEVLVLARMPGKEGRGRLEVYDSAAEKSRLVAELPGSRQFVIPSLAADGRNVVWQVSAGKSVREIWTAPLAGGKARLVTELTGSRSDLDAISVNGDQIIWSERSGGVWRVPLAGGAPDRITATDGLHLLRWPWASDAPAGPDLDDRNQTVLVDLTLITSHEVDSRPGAKGVRCGPHWCLGRGAGGSFLQRINGSDLRDIDGVFGHPKPLSMAPLLNRFVPLKHGVHDVATGSTATIKARTLALGTAGEPSTILYWIKKQGSWEVLNLAAVPSAQ
ncbi:TolB family protein [Nonomuraea sp. GTA35]|uniref:TolB family protein n=1 Tax=Nonomuraea sp. GTA35 TaxID=1676746 RepID=UPI0035C255F6